MPWDIKDISAGLKLLAKFSGGNARQLECMLAASASVNLDSGQETRQAVDVRGLKVVFQTDFQFVPSIWERVSADVRQGSVLLCC